jgi:NhaA family Na+:H+ antiporter
MATEDAPLVRKRPVPRVVFAIVAPLQGFFRSQAAGGVLLFAATVAALLLANSRFAAAYHEIFAAPVEFRVAGRGIAWPLHHWINDALMSFFFLLAGLEIKREVVLGELRTLGRAALPLLAAAAGMGVPALIYTLFNRGGPGAHGWGIPTATDIAFAVGCLTLVRRRVPASLFVFLTALAIFDDLGAILVIAFFYGAKVSLAGLGVVAALTFVLLALSYLRVQSVWPYMTLGVLLWLAVLESGIHATLAGVILGFTIPARPARAPRDVLADLEAAIAKLRQAKGREGTIAAIERHLEAVQPPLDRITHGLQGVVAFAIVPAFALVNAGVGFGHGGAAATSSAIAQGTALGLLVGKPLGIFLATWLAVKLRLAPKPTSATWWQVLGVSILAGIGFTMSLFVANLAFRGDAALVDEAKVGILAGSGICAIVGLALLRGVGRPVDERDVEQPMPVRVDLPEFAAGFRLAPWTPSGPLVGQTLAEGHVRQRFGVSVVGRWRGKGEGDAPRKLESVDAEYRISPDDTLLLVGEVDAVDQFLAAFRPRAASPSISSELASVPPPGG